VKKKCKTWSEFMGYVMVTNVDMRWVDRRFG